MATIVFYACIWVPFLQLKRAFAMTMGFVFFTSPPIESFTQESVMLWKEKEVAQMMEIKAPLQRISLKYQLGRLREHEQRSSRMYSTDSSKSYGLKQIRGGPLSMIHVGNKE
jgi:hypothetical protein